MFPQLLMFNNARASQSDTSIIHQNTYRQPIEHVPLSVFDMTKCIIHWFKWLANCKSDSHNNNF